MDNRLERAAKTLLVIKEILEKAKPKGVKANMFKLKQMVNANFIKDPKLLLELKDHIKETEGKLKAGKLKDNRDPDVIKKEREIKRTASIKAAKVHHRDIKALKAAGVDRDHPQVKELRDKLDKLRDSITKGKTADQVRAKIKEHLEGIQTHVAKGGRASQEKIASLRDKISDMHPHLTVHEDVDHDSLIAHKLNYKLKDTKEYKELFGKKPDKAPIKAEARKQNAEALDSDKGKKAIRVMPKGEADPEQKIRPRSKTKSTASGNIYDLANYNKTTKEKKQTVAGAKIALSDPVQDVINEKNPASDAPTSTKASFKNTPVITRKKMAKSDDLQKDSSNPNLAPKDVKVKELQRQIDAGTYKPDPKKIADKVVERVKFAKNGQWSLEKSNYGPKGAGAYSAIDNAKRKETRTSEVREDIGQNKAVRQYTTTGSSTDKARTDVELNRQKALNRKAPVKNITLSPEEKAKIEARYNAKKP